MVTRTERNHIDTMAMRFDQISFHACNSSLEGATELNFAPFCSYWDALSSFFAESKFSVSGRKPLTIVRRFYQVYFRAHNSSLEGATKLTFAPFCSSWDALSDEIIFFAESKFSIYGEKNHGLK